MLDKSSIRVDIFSHSLSSILDDNLSSYLISTVSNMLALHYAIDNDLQKVEPSLQAYSQLCATRIKDFLQEKVVLEEKFNTAVGLFAIALTPEIPESEDLPSMNKLRDHERIMDVLGLVALGMDISNAELRLFSDVMDVALGGADSEDILNLIQSKPEIIKAILKDRKSSAKVGTKELAQKISDLAKSSSIATSITSDFAQLAGLVACSALAFAGNIVAVHSFESIAAAVIIPVTVVTLNYGTQIGEKLGSKLSEFENGFKAAKKEIDAILSNVIPTIENSIGVVVNEVKQDVSMTKINVQDITKDLTVHIDTKSTKEQLDDIKKSLKSTALMKDVERGI